MCLVGPPGPLGSKMEVMTHVVNFLLKKYTFLLALSLPVVSDDTQVIRKYNISEENNSQMFSYMLNVLVCVCRDPRDLSGQKWRS